MTKQEQIEEIAKIIDEMYWVYDTTAGDIAEELYNAGYRKISENAVVLTKEEYIDLSRNYVTEQIEQARKETAKVILYMLYDMGIDKETLECCRIFDVNGVSLAKQICEKYDVEIEK